MGQPYPTRHIELVSPTGAGGGSDLVARTVADIVAKEKLLPQPIIVQNRAGGGGAIGQTYVAGKRGDPYIFIQAAIGLISVPLRTGLDVGIDKFQPLGAIGLDLNSISVAENSPYRTLKEQGFDIHAGGLRGFVAPAGIPRDAAKVLEDMLAKVHKSAGWRDYMARNMYEDVYMNADELARWLAAQQVEMTQFLTEMGLVLKK